MNKVLAVTVGLGLAVSLQAGSIKCNFPVVKCEPIYKTVIKKIPHKECWEEQQKSAVSYKQSGLDTCTTGGIVVSKRCFVTKCKTVYDTVEEQVLVGYKNYAKCACKTFSKISNKKLKFITTTLTY